MISVRQESDRGGTAVMVYTETARRTFARVTAMLDELGLTIVDARITPTADGHSLDTYHVLESDGTPIDDLDRAQQIDRALTKVAAQGRWIDA